MWRSCALPDPRSYRGRYRNRRGPMVWKHHPADLELDAELAGQRFAEFKFKTAAIAGLAGEWQRIGIGADQEDAPVQDGFERTGIRNAGRRHAGQHGRHDEPRQRPTIRSRSGMTGFRFTA